MDQHHLHTMRFGWLACVATLANAGSAVAADVQIDVRGHYETGVGTTDSASAGYITPQLIDDRPLLRPGEVLEYVPGMIVTQHSGAGKANQYFLRGFNLDHGTDFATSIAGMPVNLRSHAHGQGYTDLNFMIPELVSHVEYYKGPYYAQQGDFATAGSADIQYADKLSRRIAELSGGSYRFGRILLAGSAQVSAGDLLYGLELYHDDGPWQNPDNFRKLNAVLRYSQPFGEGHFAVTAMGYSGRWNSTDQIPQRAVDSGLVDRLGAIDPTDGGRSFRYSLSADYGGPAWGGEVRSTAYAIGYYLKLYSNFTYYLNDPVNGDQFNQADHRTVYGWNGQWSRAGELFGSTMRNSIGWDIRQDRISPVGIYDTVQRQPIGIKREDDVRETSYAVYAENQLQWTPWFRSIAGLRGDLFRNNVHSNLEENSGSRRAGLVSPKLSLVFSPWTKTEFFVNAGDGYHSNDARGTTTHVDPATGDPVQPATPLVRAKGAEIGARTEIVPGLQSSLSLWYLHLDSELVFSGDTGTDEIGRPSRRTGIEWSNHYTPIKWLLVDLDLASTNARFTDSDAVGNHIPDALRTTAAGGITVRNLGPWTASLFGRYFGPRPLIEDASVKSRSTTLFNAQVTYQLNSRTRLRFDVFNLFDRKADDITYYYTSRLPGEPLQGVNDIHFHPVESRSLRVALQYEL